MTLRDSKEKKKTEVLFVTLSWKIYIVISVISYSLPRPIQFIMGGDYPKLSAAILEAGYHPNYDIKLKVPNFMTGLSLDVNNSP